MSFPQTRMRRLRQHPQLRALVAETTLSMGHLVLPLFVVPGEGVRRPISALPGHFHYSPDTLAEEVISALQVGVKSFLLFGIPKEKSKSGKEAWSRPGTLQKALQNLKRECPEAFLITDVCLCSYTADGQCELTGDGNDRTIAVLADIALSHAEGGADMVAPSDMMDGRVCAIRSKLDEKGFEHLPILSYSVKYASAFYGPFRVAADSAPLTADRRGYQMNPANVREALHEVELDIEEGADIVMVKPAIPYLDVIAKLRERFAVPIAAFDVSGSYAMVRAAAAREMLDEERALWEMLVSIKRAGADIIITYAAKEMAEILKEQR